jgi:hypothetical protein
VARNRRRYVSGLYILRIEDAADGACYQWRVHDRAIHNGVLCQWLQAKTNQLKTLSGAVQLDGFDGARANVQPHESFLSSTTKHFETPQEFPELANLQYRAIPKTASSFKAFNSGAIQTPLPVFTSDTFLSF